MEVLISVSEQIALAIERKQIIETLKKKEKTISLITDNTSSIIAIIDAHGVFEFANPAHKKLGYDFEKLWGTSFFDLMHPDDAIQLINFLGKGITGHASHLTLEFRIKNNLGNFQPIMGTFDLIKDKEGFTEKLIFIGEDISAREKNQKEMKEIEERFGLIFNSSPDAIIITQLKSGKIFDVNTAFTRLCGIKKENLIGQVTTDLGIWENKQQRSDFISLIKRKETYENLEATLIFKGNPIETLISSRPLTLDGQHHLLSIIRDISNRKNLGAQLARQRKMDAITTLAGSVAHDFNNLLSSIMGHLEYLNADENGNLKEPQKDSIVNASIASKKAAKLVRQLQSLTRADESIPGPVDLFKIANDVFTILGQTTNRLIEKRNELIENKYFVLGFEHELHQALMNIGINATQAIELLKDRSNGTIRLHIPSDDTHTPPSPLDRDKSFLHICFEDTGCGMTPEVQKQAFDPMFTNWPVTDKKNLGMGLAIVDNIITKKHKGVIHIESGQEKGTTLHLYLPKASKPSSAGKQRISAAQKPETILVIDDEDMVRDMAVKSLTSFGYSTLEAPDGKTGVAIYKKNQNRIGAVLLDIIMPGMSGVETFKQLLMIDPQVKVIIASGHITNQEQRKLFTKACAYLDKPYQIMELKRALHSILDQPE